MHVNTSVTITSLGYLPTCMSRDFRTLLKTPEESMLMNARTKRDYSLTRSVRSIAPGLFLCAIVLCALSGNAAAQGGSGCPWRPFACGQYSIWNATCYPPVPLGAIECNGFDFTLYCLLPPLCPPADPVPCDCGAGSPISFANGNTYIEEADVRLPGLSGGLTLKRRWNSILSPNMSAYHIGLFGPNWRSNFEERVFLGSDNYVKYARGDGSLWSLTYISTNGGASVYTVVAPSN